jgi:hypothetical protein
MQTYGVGTALKILLGYPTPYKHNEIVALLNVFNKISMSVSTYYEHRKKHISLGYEKVKPSYSHTYNLVAGLLAIAYVWYRYKVSFLSEKAVARNEVANTKNE